MFEGLEKPLNGKKMSFASETLHLGSPDAAKVSEVQLLERLVPGRLEQPVADLRRHVVVAKRRRRRASGVAHEASL